MYQGFYPLCFSVQRLGVFQATLNKAVYRLTAYLNIRNIGERVFSDLAETWWMIGLSLIAACLLSFVWIFLMRYLAGGFHFVDLPHILDVATQKCCAFLKILSSWRKMFCSYLYLLAQIHDMSAVSTQKRHSYF